MKSITRFAALVTTSIVLLMPSLASAAFTFSWTSGSGGGYGGVGCNTNLCYIGATILYIINDILVPVLFAVAFIVFLYGVAKKYIFSHGDQEGVAEGHKLILWGIIGFVVMVSLWGLVHVVSNTFGLEGDYAPLLPTSTGGPR